MMSTGNSSGTAADPGSIFVRILDKYYPGKHDAMTLDVLEALRK